MESSSCTRNIATTSGIQTSEILGSGRPLLPGIPDEITLDNICTKLPWQTFKALSLVSLSWQKAVDNRQVYNARVRNNAAESLVVHTHGSDGDSRICLYSTRDECCHELPPIPQLGDQIPASCECIELDGKLYVLGGEKRRGSDAGSAEGFILDVAGRMEWKQCGSMGDPRQSFGCGISGGKIYVFGGKCHEMMVRVSEVYDPKVKSWSSITPMPVLRCHDHVATVGKELFVFGGYVADDFAMDWNANAYIPGVHCIRDLIDPYPECNLALCDHLYNAKSLQIYHPTTDEWKVVKAFFKHDIGHAIFVAKRELLWLSEEGVSVYDMDKESWTERHSFSGAGQEPNLVRPQSFAAADNELFAIVYRPPAGLFQSRGFDSGKKEIQWHRTSCPGPSDVFTGMFSISI